MFTGDLPRYAWPMAVLFVLGGVGLIVGLVAVFTRLYPGPDADRPAHGSGGPPGIGGGGDCGGAGGSC